MSDTKDTQGGETERYDCPEGFCVSVFRPQEMVAHLQWDHGYSEYKAEMIVERELGVAVGDGD